MLAIWNSKRDITLLLSVVGICCLISGPFIFYIEVGGSVISDSRQPNIDSIPVGMYKTS